MNIPLETLTQSPVPDILWTMEKSFFDRLEAVCREKNTLLCVGLDPKVEVKSGENPRVLMVEANRRIIEATLPYAACYKPNIAFYEAWGIPGLQALEETLNLIPADVPVILDAKRGDIGNTAEAYAQGTFAHPRVSAVTLAPYMGFDSVEPFLKYKNKGVFVLARTSNPGAKEIQDLNYKGKPFYRKMAKIAAGWSNQIGLVVAGNDTTALKAIRKDLPYTWFLSPGIGAQGGTMDQALTAGLRGDGLGILPVVAREISGAKDPGEKARELRDQLNDARDRVMGNKSARPVDKLKRKVLEGLIRTECFKLGEFTLKSGIKSPFYVDLRRVSSDAEVLKAVGKAYTRLMKGLSFDRLAGIPLAALPLATAASLESGASLIYPRIPPKAHGAGNAIEGEYKSGEKALLLDDLITTGKSKLEAIEILRGEGLVVEDLVVLLERGTQGRMDMKTAGVRLHAFAQVEEFFDVCLAMKLIDETKRQELLQFVKDN